ncbi:MAG: hypothetical protein JXA41_06535 [Deltaproteobacteria bacterium]|nr:hypothetical protein [Deltaproteobacteria bacterium]
MRSFEYGYYLETPLSHALLMAMRALGEFRGRQTLYTDQFPEVLASLRRVGRYISMERIVEDSKESYYEALNKSSQGWHEGKHDLRPWWNYFLGMLTAAYKEFEERVGKITSARGAKREMVRNAVERLPQKFTIGDLKRACPGVSYPTLQRALADMRNEKKVRCLGRGPDAEWEQIKG